MEELFSACVSGGVSNKWKGGVKAWENLMELDWVLGVLE